MNKKDKYFGDSRYEKVWEQMKLLGIQDVSTKRQDKNGTIVWKLPIKNQWNNGSLIEVASFSTGYVRNQNSCYSNYQLNKCEKSVEYFPDYKWVGDEQVKTGKFNEFVTKKRILIPIEIERLEYLISYCLKNYYIKNANNVPNGEYIPKWKYESDLERHDVDREISELQSENRDLEDKLEQAKDKYKKLDDFYESSKVFNDSMYEGRDDRVKELEDKLDTIQRVAKYE